MRNFFEKSKKLFQRVEDKIKKKYTEMRADKDFVLLFYEYVLFFHVLMNSTYLLNFLFQHALKKTLLYTSLLFNKPLHIIHFKA